MKLPYRKFKFGEIIYPIELEKRWFERMRWVVINGIGKKGFWVSAKWFDNMECAENYSRIIKLERKTSQKNEVLGK